MNIIKAFLYIENETHNLTSDIFDALQILDAAAERFFICGRAANSAANIKEIDRRIKENKAELYAKVSKGLKGFDDFSLTENLLIVTIGNPIHLKLYIANRLNQYSDSYSWNIINSSYARIGYFERQKNLSDFIPADTARWLKIQLKNYGEQAFYEFFNRKLNSNILILGETIIDEYILCDALGKVTKDPLVAFEKREKHEHLGGVLAVARHFNGLEIQANVISKWANLDQEFIQNSLNYNTKINTFNLVSNKSIKKTRYVDRSTNARVFESYELPNATDYLTSVQDIKKLLRNKAIEFDHLLIMDYGHNFFDHENSEDYLNFGVPVSVNTQSNAGNRGFNPISNYLNADLVFLNGSEVRTEMRNNSRSIENTIKDLSIKLNCKELYVTNGSSGVISWDNSNGIQVTPTFAPTIIDRTGAGDALLAVVLSLRLNNVPKEIATFFGNIAGSLLIGVMGNEKSITMSDLQLTAEKIIHKVKLL